MDWMFEILSAIGKFFLHPLFYLGFLYAIWLGYRRVKRERKDFHIRVQDGWFEFRTYITKGLLPGMILSLIIFIVGSYVSFSFIFASCVVTFILALMLKPQFLSPAWTGGFTFFLLWAMQQYDVEIPFISKYVSLASAESLVSIPFILALLLLAESYLLYKNAAFHTSPKIIRSQRGLQVGIHESSRLWMVPLLLILPEGVVTIPYDFWPLMPLKNESFSLIFIPYWIGFKQEIWIDLPKVGVQITAKRVFVLSLVVLIVAVIGFWYPLFSIISVAIAMIGRLIIPIAQRIQNHSHPYYFSQNDKGIMILDIIPNSPAAKMGLKIGEIIKKVNGIAIDNDADFYEALQQNRAFCKLEVIDHNGENRFVNRALYEGEHHELGILFVEKEKQWLNDVG